MRTYLAVLALAFCALVVVPAQAAYPERQIDMIVPYGAGGGFDLYARALASVMEKRSDGAVKVITRNVPGARGRRGTATLFRAAPDGYTIGIVNVPGAVEPQILGEKVNYDTDKFNWLGTINRGVYAFVLGKKSKYKSLEDMRKAEQQVWFATTGSNDFAMGKIATNVLGIKAKFVTGYKGGPAAHLAIVRGEADAGLAIATTVRKHVVTGDLKPVLLFQENDSEAAFKGVGTVEDIGQPKLASLTVFRMFAAPPGLPAEVRAKLTEMVQGALNDPALEAWSKKVNYPVFRATAERTKALFEAQKAFLTRYKDLLKK